MTVITKTLHYLIDLINPSRCFNCDTVVTFSEDHICRKCLDEIIYVVEKCERCSGVLRDGSCTVCSDRDFFIARNMSIAEYDGIVREMLHCIKFENHRRLLNAMARIMAERVKDFDRDFDLVTFIPMNRKKKWKRGFNQSEVMAKAVSRAVSSPLKKVMAERFRTETQKDLGYRDRFINVIDRYRVINDTIIQGKSVLIIDDVFTTGATLTECARVLLEAGASDVFSMTFARAGLKRLEII